MQKYRHRQNTQAQPFEAIQLLPENVNEVMAWIDGTVTQVEEIDSLDPTKRYVGVNFTSWRGPDRASEGDYICKDGLGDFHVRWAENFEHTFEEVNDASQVNLDHAGDEPR
jgi:hypothetical protein